VNLRLEGMVLGLRATGGRPPEEARPHTAAVALARAHKLQERIDSGEFAGRAELARALGFTLARVSQMLDLTLLAPDIQEEVLFLGSGEGGVTESDLRWVLGAPVWVEQRGRWAEVTEPGKGGGPQCAAIRVSSRRQQ